ncbi:hypothetical protein CXB51_008659 [Gossypium anomalum]|uniref:Uncharacterized protein n=1 Tax=Gossypium anomalum TaxID=47600 RepID=A0A8J5Z9C4_9ROSI|nr:hypothetical protein CXB51_008659 [Gossypium anomalum]
MAGELICLDHKHISVKQMKMSSITVDRKLLEGSGFLTRGQYRPGVQVGPETHQRVNRENVQLQLGLSVDGFILTRSIQSAESVPSLWRTRSYDLLGAIPDNIYEGRIEMGWLRDTFSELGNDSTEVERIRYAQAYILELIGDYLMPDLSRNLVHLRLNHPASYVEIPTTLEDIWLLLDQRLEAYIPEVLDDEHKINLQQSNTNWPIFFSEYKKIWKNQYDHIPTRKPIIVPELAYAPDYMPWFRIYSKLYLLSEEQRHRQIRVEKERRAL